MSARKDDRSRSKNEESPDYADQTFPNRHRRNVIWECIEKTIPDIGR